MEAMTQTVRDSNVIAFYSKWVRDFCGVREIKLPQKCFWLVLLKLAVTAVVL